MKPLISTLLLVLAAASAQAATTPAAPQWAATDNIDTPESAYYDTESKQIFVSNVAGQAGDKDGKGWIATITVDAKNKPTVKKLVEGLNAPKGLRARAGKLYVTDIDELLTIDIKSGKIVERVAVPGAKFLNDLAVDKDGKVYVSDMLASKILVVDHGKVSTFAEGDDLESPNGLYLKDGKLFVAAWGLITDPATFGAKTPGHLFALDLKTKAKTLVTKTPLGNLDGIENAANGDWLVSDWVAGKVYRVTPAGQATLILDGIKNSADIGLQGSTLLVPAMGGNEVSAIPL